LILGLAIASASSFDVNSKSFPNNALPKENDEALLPYKSTLELNPWFYIDYEDQLYIDNVIMYLFP
jgi:hypothetical protein